MQRLLTFKNFSLIFLCVLALEITLDLAFDSRWGVYVTKPLLMILLLVWAKAVSNRQNNIMNLLYLGLIFSWLGDVFLMFRSELFFLFGLSSFLLAHIFYIWMFISEISKGSAVPMRQKVLRSFPFLIFYIGFMAFLLPAIADKDSQMLAPVMIYAFTISFMGYMASLRSRAVSPQSYAMVLIGAIAFTLSDSCIAINKFISPIPYTALPVMSLYGIGQLFICTGILRENNKIENFI